MAARPAVAPTPAHLSGRSTRSSAAADDGRDRDAAQAFGAVGVGLAGAHRGAGVDARVLEGVGAGVGAASLAATPLGALGVDLGALGARAGARDLGPHRRAVDASLLLAIAAPAEREDAERAGEEQGRGGARHGSTRAAGARVLPIRTPFAKYPPLSDAARMS